MNREKEVTKILKELKAFYAEDDYGIFAKEWILEDIEEVLADERPIGTALDALKDLSAWSLHDTLHALLEKNDPTQALHYFRQSSAYGVVFVQSTDSVWGCWGISSKQHYEFTATISRMMAQALICRWEEEMEYVAQSMIDSIAFGHERIENKYEIHKIIATGFEWDKGAWFILELYCKVYNKTFDRKKAAYPKSMIPYDKALDRWDSKDTQEVDKLIYLLCEKHVEQSQEQKTDNDYFEFGDTYSKLFPYEILTWLKLREKAGLKNPKTFTHPLMNTPIAKMFLSLKEPLPYPTELPYAKELLEKLQEKCPDVEIPQWLNNTKATDTTPTQNTNQNDILPDNFMK